MSKEVLDHQKFRIELDDGSFLSGDVRTIKDGAAKPVLLIGHGFRGHKDWGTASGCWRRTGRFASWRRIRRSSPSPEAITRSESPILTKARPMRSIRPSRKRPSS